MSYVRQLSNVSEVRLSARRPNEGDNAGRISVAHPRGQKGEGKDFINDEGNGWMHNIEAKRITQPTI